MENSLEILEKVGCLRTGHFILSSGMRSEKYIQCSKLFENPKSAEIISSRLAKKIEDFVAQNSICFDYVLSPAMGAIIAGYVIAKNLKTKNIFCERVDGTFEVRRNFEIKPGDKILLLEDVLTTGKTSLEARNCAHEFGAEVVLFASIINRSGKTELKNTPIVSLIDLDINIYHPDELPEKLKKVKPIKPGSRNLEK